MIVGYCRVSSEAQGADGYGLEAQEQAIVRACEARGWEAPRLVREVASGSEAGRPVLADAVLDVFEARVNGDRGILMVARLDRLTRSIVQFASLMEAAQRDGWEIVCLDPAVDMTTPYGRAMAGMAAVFAQLERELISQRTREALAHVTMPQTIITPEVGEVLQDLLASGMSQTEAARAIGVTQPTVSKYLKKVRQR
jgi:DNA invertase Pin-like site-specific DNA recombinase